MTNAGFLPSAITAGESIWIDADNTAQSSVDITFGDYTPADGYTLAYQFADATPISVDAVANDEDTGWTLDVTGAQTLIWQPGQLVFTGLVTHTATGRIFAVDSGSINVSASPLRVSSWVAVVAAADAAILNYAASPNSSFSVDGVTIAYRSIDDLIALRDYAQYRLKQDTKSGIKRIIKSRFNV